MATSTLTLDKIREQILQDEQKAAFLNRIERGEKIEATDWMPEEYRQLLIRLIHMHGISEVMGCYPEKEWVPKAPNLRRKLAIMAKVQDEVGHGQLLLRVAEDLAAPLNRTREDLMADLFVSKVKFHNVFHMEARTWADAGLIGWLVDGAAICTQASLLDTSYAPYGRTTRDQNPEPFSLSESLLFGACSPSQKFQSPTARWEKTLSKPFAAMSKKLSDNTYPTKEEPKI